MDRAVETTRLILASASPRRRRLMREAGWEFEVVEPPLAEPGEDLSLLAPARLAEAIAYFKARTVAESAAPNCCILAADTIVSVDGRVLGKAGDAREAGRMLRTLSGTRHEVITGVAIIGPGQGRLIASDVTYVTMRELSEDEIASYVASGEWVGKAGAYAIQETADRFVESVEGSFSNVVGLPMELTKRMIRELRLHPAAHEGI